MKTTLLDKIIDERKRKLELERKETFNRIFEALESARKDFYFERAYIFGSVIKSGKFNEHSDIDIAVENVSPEYFFKLKIYLEDKLNMEIDLIDIKDVHFKESIKKEGILWMKED